MKFLEAFANIFRVPDLRKRLLFTLATAGGVPSRRARPHARHQHRAVDGVLQFRGGLAVQLLRHVCRRQYPPPDGFRPGHHAVHHGVHHSAVAHRGRPHPRKTAERGRTGPPQDHPVDPLPHHRPFGDSVGHHRRRPAVHEGRHRHQPGLRVRHADHYFADYRHGVHHVAGRADQRTRRGQRHVADHLHGHRGRPAARHQQRLLRTPS